MTSVQNNPKGILLILIGMAVFSVQDALIKFIYEDSALYELYLGRTVAAAFFLFCYCLLYTSPSPRDRTRCRMPSSA